jgi:molybdate transport system ATP-binding protein
MRLECDLRVELGAFSLQARLDAAGTRFGLFGPSGAGKSTLIRALAGLEPATGWLKVDGEVWLDSACGLITPACARQVGWVPQHNALFPHLSVGENLTFSHRADGDWLKLVVQALELESLLARSTTGLSGGEAKRVALGRALAARPRLLLLDEPLAGLDWRMKQQLLGILLRLQSRFDTPWVFVSHDPSEVGLFCRDVWLIRQGRIEAQGPTEQVFLRPESEAAALVAGLENRWEAVVRGVAGTAVVLDAGGLCLHAEFDGAADLAVVAMVPASEVLLAPPGPALISARNSWTGKVCALEHRVHGILVRLECLRSADGSVADIPVPLCALVTPAAAADLSLCEGMLVSAIFKSSAVRVFPL